MQTSSSLLISIYPTSKYTIPYKYNISNIISQDVQTSSSLLIPKWIVFSLFIVFNISLWSLRDPVFRHFDIFHQYRLFDIYSTDNRQLKILLWFFHIFWSFYSSFLDQLSQIWSSPMQFVSNSTGLELPEI